MIAEEKLTAREEKRLSKEFSKQNFIILKDRYPEMKHTLMASMVSNKWIQMDDAQKRSHNQYPVEMSVSKDNELQSTPARHPNFVALAPTNQKPKSAKIQKLDFDIEGPSVNLLQVRQMPEKEETISKPEKSKKIQKQTESKYLTFFKYYYEKYSQQHPGWNSCQITTIIKLLWRKRKNGLISIQGKIKKEKAMKKLTGRQSFNMAHKSLHQTAQINRMWKMLPKQAKINWEIKGNPQLQHSPALIKTKTNITLPIEKIEQPAQKMFGFLHTK